jgi:nucleotide-binding universal stress UspA family protein
MIRIKKILVPVDFSEPSKKAVNYGLSLCLEFKSRLVLTHIAPYDALAYLTAKASLLELIPADYREKINFEIIVKSGDVRQELLGIVEDKDINLVVMGSRGRSYFERVLLGSVTERMLRKLHVPVLTVSHLDPGKELHSPGPVPLRKLLYATDLAENSEAGLEFSIRLARGLDAQLVVVHVVQAMDAGLLGLEGVGVATDYVTEVRAQAAERLSKLVALVSDGRVPITTVLADGVPCDAIIDLTIKQNVDLVIIDLHERGRLERALLGATAERVIRTAAVPVLSLPMPANYFSHWAAA